MGQIRLPESIGRGAIALGLAGLLAIAPMGAGSVSAAAASTVPAAPLPAAPGDDIGLNADFETDLGPWQARGPSTVERTDTESHSGSHSASVTDRAEAWNGVGADVTGVFTEGSPYTISAWVKLPDEATDPADLRLSIQRENAGADTAYDTIATVTGVTGQEWVEVSASYTMTAADNALLYLETTDGTADFLVDDIVITTAAQDVQLDIPALADEVPWPMGVAIDERETTGAPAQLVTHHYNQLTAENHMKPESIQPEEGVFTFEAADQLVDFALANDMTVYGHTLVWHSQTPDWFFTHPDGTPLTDDPADQELLAERMRTHIHTVADHFRDSYGEYGTPGNPIVAFDVVNEAIAEGEADGLRRSPWYQVLGEQYLDLAFEYADAAFGDEVVLFLNDYNTELPAKRQAMYDVAARLLDRGAPIDGLGHQFHVSLTQPVSQMRASIEKFAELGLIQGVTELDAPIDGTVTEEKLVEQGYYYADVFEMLREYPLFAVTIWGPYDSRSWREGAPLPFDDYLQAKPAYWGIVDPRELPPPTRALNVHRAQVPADETGLDALDWQLLPLAEIEAVDGATTGFQARWSDAGLTVYVEVADATENDGDLVEVFTEDAAVSIGRDGEAEGQAQLLATAATTAVSEPTEAGYAVVLDVPLTDPAEGMSLPFDVRVTDGATGEQVSWNDLSHGQEDGQRLGTITLVEPLGFAAVPAAPEEPAVDGQMEDLWSDAVVVSTDVQVEGEPGASADVRLLWTPEQLHLLFQVTDAELDESNSNAWEQDSVEVFLDPDNAKAGPLRAEDGQYRVSFSGAESISGVLEEIGENLTSASAPTEAGYAVEIALDLDEPATAGDLLGLELQVNDAAEGVRSSVRTWSDPSGRSYQDTSRWGVVQLVAAEEDDDAGGDADGGGDAGDSGDAGADPGDAGDGDADGGDSGAGADPGDDAGGAEAGTGDPLPGTGADGAWALALLALMLLTAGAALTLHRRLGRP